MNRLINTSIILICLVLMLTFAFAEQSQNITITIAVDNLPPTGSIVINNNDSHCNSSSVTLSLSADDSDGSGVCQMQFSNDNIHWSTPEGYTTSKPWTLVEGDGEKIVYVKFKDVLGNWSNPFSDSIILDTTAPVVHITSPLSGSMVTGAP